MPLVIGFQRGLIDFPPLRKGQTDPPFEKGGKGSSIPSFLRSNMAELISECALLAQQFGKGFD
jgi:hypothetical protein